MSKKIAARIGLATVAVHPFDAAEHGLSEGDEVVLSNETGQLRVHVTLLYRHPSWRCPVAQRPVAKS